MKETRKQKTDRQRGHAADRAFDPIRRAIDSGELVITPVSPAASEAGCADAVPTCADGGSNTPDECAQIREERDQPWCPLCLKGLEYVGWTSVEARSAWACGDCDIRVEIDPFLPSKERKALVPSLSQMDPTRRVVAADATLSRLRNDLEGLVQAWRARGSQQGAIYASALFECAYGLHARLSRLPDQALRALCLHLDDETPFTVMEGIERLALDLNAEHERAEAADSTLARLRSDLEGLAEKALTRFTAVESWGTEREPGRGTSVVIRRSDALHVLLFLRTDLKALLTHVQGQPASIGSDEQP